MDTSILYGSMANDNRIVCFPVSRSQRACSQKFEVQFDVGDEVVLQRGDKLVIKAEQSSLDDRAVGPIHGSLSCDSAKEGDGFSVFLLGVA